MWPEEKSLNLKKLEIVLQIYEDGITGLKILNEVVLSPFKTYPCQK
jgi:hypothetical protein